MLIFSFFKTLVGKEVVVELKNGVEISGKLHSVDQFLNVKLENLGPNQDSKFPQLSLLENAFVRGSSVRYISMKKADVEVQALEDATRRMAAKAKAEEEE